MSAYISRFCRSFHRQSEGLRAYSVSSGIVNVLKTNGFGEDQIDKICHHLDERRNVIRGLSPELISKNLHYWKTTIDEPHGECSLEEFNVNHVISDVEPDLLIVSTSTMDKRRREIMDLGIVSGRSDFWKLFSEAPKGWLLQEWSDVRRKFYYFQYSLMEWVLKGTREKYPVPHPMIKYPQIIEMSYERIKSRHLFADKCGYKSISITAELTKKPIDLHTLLLKDVHDYLKMVAPHCDEQEYSTFEKMISKFPDEQDEIIMGLAELGGMVHPHQETQEQTRKKISQSDFPEQIKVRPRKKRNKKVKCD